MNREHIQPIVQIFTELAIGNVFDQNPVGGGDNTDDYLDYTNLISESTRQAGTAIWAYCPMPNHLHLVMLPSTEDSLRATLRETHRHYTRHINFRQNWRGHIDEAETIR